MKQSKSSLLLLAICLALFGIGMYLRVLHRGDAAIASQADSTPAPTDALASPAPGGLAMAGAASPTASPPSQASAEPLRAATPTLGAADALRALGNRAVDQKMNLAKFDDARAFQKITDDVKASIPSVEHLHSLKNEDVNGPPAEIQNAMVEMGRMAEAIQKHPEFAAEAQKFYQSCALNGEYPTSVRALCYADLVGLLRKQGLTNEAFSQDRDVPDQVKLLAAKIL